MSDPNDRLAFMGETLTRLKEQLSTLTAQMSRNVGLQDKFWDAMVPIKWGLEELLGIDDAAPNLDNAVHVSGVAIQTLEEKKQEALNSDEVWELWVDLAQSTSDSITNAIGVARYDLREFAAGVGKNLKKELPEPDTIKWTFIGVIVLAALVFGILLVK